jgi:hypothetical protein
MENITYELFLPYLLSGLGISLILIGIFKKTTTSDLLMNGEKVEGIVFELGMKSSGFSGSNINDKVTIRFVTKKKEWITTDINQDFATFFTGQYKLGQKVDVYYKLENPSNFVVDTKQSEKKARMLLLLVGTVFCMAGLSKLFLENV